MFFHNYLLIGEFNFYFSGVAELKTLYHLRGSSGRSIRSEVGLANSKGIS